MGPKTSNIFQQQAKKKKIVLIFLNHLDILDKFELVSKWS